MLLVPVRVPWHVLEMYNQNPEHKGVGAPPMSPRISFSNDFVESSHSHSHSHSHSYSHSHQQKMASYRDAPVSSDFEFSVSNYSMMTADELFFKGRLLPLKETCSNGGGSSVSSFQKTTTLREELQNEDDDSDDFSLRPPKNPTRWKGFLGLRKSHIGSKKSERPVEKRTGGYHHDDVQCSKNSQEFID